MSLLQMSFSGAVLIIVIAAVRAVAVNRLPKKTFLVLWGIVLFRLLIPYTVPSAASVYNLASPKMAVYETDVIFADTADTGNATAQKPANAVALPAEAALHQQTNGQQRSPAYQITPASIISMIWLTGMLLSAAFFMHSYLHWRFEFQASLPIQNDDIKQWQKAHSQRRAVLVRQSDKISAPLTYGIIKPVILMPKNTDWENTKQLEYILFHEYVHICRYDNAAKLLFALALCLHWFNPFVWGMYFLSQRDIELACDESVVRRLGETSKAVYARMLIDMEAKKSGLQPFCSSFSKNAIEERIIAIMKTKKTSVIATLLSVVLIIGVTTAFATTAAEKKVENNSTNFSDAEFDKLSALQFDGYENMSISEYQSKVWKLTDTAAYRDLLERFSQDTELYGKKDSDETANFLFYTLEPLTAQKWKAREFDGYCVADYEDACDNAALEYSITLTIQNADTLTVREYNNTRIGMMNGLKELLQGKKAEELQNEAVMQKMLQAETDALKSQWSSDKLKVDVDYAYRPLFGLTTQDSDAQSAAKEAQQEQETREYPNGTEEDYRSLLALKTPDYQQMSVADFNLALLDWANENYERMERIGIDTAYHDFAVELTDEELSFVTTTVMFSGMENGAHVRSNYTGKPEENPSYAQYLPEKADVEGGMRAWCDLYYQFSYHIADKRAVTVGERDACMNGVITGILEFWNNTDLEDLLDMTEADIVKELDKIAAEYSDDKITVTISEDQISFECMDERNVDEETEIKTGVINTDALRIREEASETAAVASLLPERQTVVILSEQNGFYHISIPDTGGSLDGWVKKEYVDVK